MPRSQVTSLSNYPFAAPRVGSRATGSVEFSTAVPVQDDSITLEDSSGNTKTFVFGTGEGEVAPGSSITEAATNFAAAVNADPILIRATSAAGVATLTQTEPLASGNTDIEAVFDTPANVTGTNFAGGQGHADDRKQTFSDAPFIGTDEGATPPVKRTRWAKATPLEFRVQEGGLHTLFFEHTWGDENISVTLEVSEDGQKYFPMTDDDHITNVAGETIRPRTKDRVYQIMLRDGVDKYVRLTATGGGRGVMQIRHDSGLDPVRI